MGDFKQYIRNCVQTGVDIMIEMHHLSTVTFEDICMLIHITLIRDVMVWLSDDVRKHINYNMIKDLNMLWIPDTHNKEELAILAYLHGQVSISEPICLCVNYDKSKPDTAVVHQISDKFIKVAERCGIISYHEVEEIRKIYKIKSDTLGGAQYFAEYMFVGPKSASKISQ